MSRRAQLDRIYGNATSNAFLSSGATLREAANASARMKNRFTRKEVNNYLAEQEPYQLHRQSEHAFKRNHFTISAPYLLFEMDLLDMKSSAKDNDGMTFVLFVIDVFSKFVWYRCLLNKSGKIVSKALREILDECLQTPSAISSDLGREFYNFRVKELFNTRKIKHHRPVTVSAWKCPHIERFLRTIKTNIRRYFTFTQQKNNRYIDILPLLVRHYNNTTHSSTKMKPSEVTFHNSPQVYQNLRSLHSNEAPVFPVQNLQTGDKVRISVKKTPLDAGVFKPSQWTLEIFTIDQVINKRPHKLYTLIDSKKKQIWGKFYSKQLQKISINKNNVNTIKNKTMSNFLLKKK